MTPEQSHETEHANARWASVLSRDRAQDGRFVYGVRSTRIFCRPSCPSRKPSRPQVQFFETPLDAQAAGYRGCKRCRPAELFVADPWVEKIRRACAYLANVEGHPSLAGLAKRVGGSPYHLQRNFKRLVGISPREFAAACRIGKVKQRLRGSADVTTAVVAAGYGSSSRFYERATARLGMTPSNYRKGGQGMSIHYAVVSAPIGRVLVAATDRGICAVAIGSSETELAAQLEREFPKATISLDRGGLREWTDEILVRVNGRAPRVDLPLDVRATSFQWQVWSALAAVPRGKTRSYSDIAVAIGRPSAARAVARACATNPVALAIPCHRVVPAVGGTGGYRWGRERKKALLEAEAQKHG